MEREPVVVDPHDVQLEAWGGLGMAGVELDELVNPQVVKLLIQERIVNLTELKAYKHQIAELGSINSNLRDDRENLRVELSRYQERERALKRVSWLEILASISSGYAINMLASNPRDGVGWFIFVVSLLMLVGSRISELPTLFERVRGKGKDYA